jgi:signal transduction histidine kinase
MNRAWIRLGAVALGCLVAGLALSWLLFVVWLHAPRSHTIVGIRYLATSGVISLLAGTLALAGLARFVPRLVAKIGMAFVFASVAAIVNVVVMPLLMFTERSDFDILVITLLYFAAISLAFSVIIPTFTAGQLHELHQGAMKLAAGDFGARVSVRGTDEVADLAGAFNRMSADLGAAFERERHLEQGRRDLIAAVSHDLRTPLASIRAMIEAINDGVVDDPATVTRYHRLIQYEAEHLGQLIDDLFELSRLASGNLELRLSSVPLPELVKETVEGLQVRAAEQGIDLHAVCDGQVPPLSLDGPRIQRALVNLIENAVRHTPPGGEVQVNVNRHHGHVEVSVADTGEGIHPDDQPHVFDQFYRGEKSRSRGSGGAGLGLAIARGIVEAHRGTIRVESAPGRGSRFVMTL